MSLYYSIAKTIEKYAKLFAKKRKIDFFFTYTSKFPYLKRKQQQMKFEILFTRAFATINVMQCNST